MGKGRPKGAANKSTETVKKAVAKLLESNIESVQTDLDQMQPRDRVNALLQFLKFHIPTQKAVEVADVSFDSRTDWIDKIMSYDPKELHKKIADATTPSLGFVSLWPDVVSWRSFWFFCWAVVCHCLGVALVFLGY